MKKTFFISLACLLASGAFSQSTVIFDGENSNNRNPWWGLDATVEVVNWLQKDGTNAANPNWGATIWRSNENPAYAGGGINLDLDITAYNTISVDISKRVSGNVQVELQNGETKAWLNVYYDANGSGGYGTGTWQTLTFSIPEGWTHLTALLIAPHNENTGENPINFTDDDERHRMSWDNVKAYHVDDLVVNEDTEIIDNKEYANITVNAGIKLTVATGGRLIANSLTLKSDAANGTATFLNNGNTTIATAKVEQYLSSADSREWYYLSSPVIGAKSSLFGTSNRIGYYKESEASYTSPFDVETKLLTGYGYVVNLVNTTNPTYTFLGKMNDGNISVIVTRTGSTAAKRGFNLVGNPYPSYLDFDALHTANSSEIQSTIWTRTFEGNNMVFKTYNADAQVGDDDQTTAHIAPLQAFWVKVSDAGAGDESESLDFANLMRSHKGTNGYYNLRVPKVASRPMIRLQVNDDLNSDRAVILFDENADNNLDSYDSEKMFVESAVPQIYTLAGTEKLVINSLNGTPDDREVSLGFKTDKSGNFTISAITLDNIADVILIDKQQNVEFNLTQGAYEFSSEVVNNSDRFTIGFRAPNVPTGVENVSAKTIIRRDTYNTKGELLQSGNLHSLPQGVYIIKQTDDKGNVYTEKMLINKNPIR